MVLSKPHVLIIPFPAQGHMLPLLDLTAHLLSSGDLTITILVTTKNLPLITPLLSLSPSIHPLVIPFPHHPSIPSGAENMKDLPASLFPSMMHALSSLKPQILSWLSSHPSPPTSIISDMFLGWTTTLPLPRICFSPSGALTISVLHSLWQHMPDRSTPTISFPSLPGSPVYPSHRTSNMYLQYTESDPISQFLRQNYLLNIASWGFALNTFQTLEGNYIQHLCKDMSHPRVWAVGPLGERSRSRSRPEILSWLDLFEEGTLLYIGFGSQSGLAPPQATAVAAAVERSGVRFVWAARADMVLPEGFEERVEAKGRVIRGWAPQREVLGHGAVGWFLTHCGWNSVMEAVAAGVAMLAWPMRADQYMNARLLVEEVGVAVRACEGAEAVPEVESMERLLRETVGEGGGLRRPERKRAEEMRRKAAEAVAEGGSSAADMAAMVREMSGLRVANRNLSFA